MLAALRLKSALRRLGSPAVILTDGGLTDTFAAREFPAALRPQENLPPEDANSSGTGRNPRYILYAPPEEELKENALIEIENSRYIALYSEKRYLSGEAIYTRAILEKAGSDIL